MTNVSFAFYVYIQCLPYGGAVVCACKCARVYICMIPDNAEPKRSCDRKPINTQTMI